jgi:hypothetical protein
MPRQAEQRHDPVASVQVAARCRLGRSSRALSALLLAGGCSWLAGAARPFTGPAGLLQALSYAVMAALAWRAWRRRLPARGGGLARTWAWAASVSLVVAFELAMYCSRPRRSHPTISSLYGELATAQPGRALVFFLWLLAGWALVGR